MRVSIEKLESYLKQAEADMKYYVEERKALAESTAKNAAKILDKQAEIDNIKLAIETLRAAHA